MAPIAPHGLSAYELTSRWYISVWTMQEAALPRGRRYTCISAGGGPNLINFSPEECRNSEEFEEKVHEFEGNKGLYYKELSSKVDVISEDTLYENLDRL
ncbi:hypothetical protein GOP47_0017293 [Adiantum capillus-veneris]|uniref:Uncharacterized protein n=1 Tax=Adiantum capillus-veneris TaxID=13818 RepID=A0A9D4UFB3_ADICA|nr:hypothetical protein GOP47_0017293 [Adiantum capillus-veneris]